MSQNLNPWAESLNRFVDPEYRIMKATKMSGQYLSLPQTALLPGPNAYNSQTIYGQPHFTSWDKLYMQPQNRLQGNFPQDPPSINQRRLCWNCQNQYNGIRYSAPHTFGGYR